MIIISALQDGQADTQKEKRNTLARGLRLPMASALKSFLFFLHSTAVMMMIISVTTAMGANTAAIIQRLLGGFLTTAEKRKTFFNTQRTVPAKTYRGIHHTHAK